MYVILPFKRMSSKSSVSYPLQLYSPAGTIPTFRVPFIDSQYLLHLAHPHTHILSALPAEKIAHGYATYTLLTI
jgi:hypothetical protein